MKKLLREKDEQGVDLTQSVSHALREYLRADHCERLWCYTDPKRKWLADAFLEVAEKEFGLKTYLTVFSETCTYSKEDLEPLNQFLATLDERDLMLAVFSDGMGANLPFHLVFPALRRPDQFRGISGHVRSRYDEQALLEHMQTDTASIGQVVRYADKLSQYQRVRVTTPGGTDLSCTLKNHLILPYQVRDDQRHAFIPPAEATFGLVPGSAEGKMVVDVTVGEFYYRGEMLDQLGLVDEPVVLTVEEGRVVKIEGGPMAQRLQDCFDQVESNCRLVIELGLGLSRGTKATGLIGTDECLQGTCHFGLGNDFFYGGDNNVPVHLDLVMKDPTIVGIE